MSVYVLLFENVIEVLFCLCSSYSIEYLYLGFLQMTHIYLR